MFTSGFQQAVSWTCRSGSDLNTRFKRCFSTPTAISVLYRNRAASATGFEAVKWYRIHVRSFLHRFPYGCLIPCLRSRVSVSERRRLMQEKLWIAGGDTLIRPSYIQTVFWATLYTEIWQHALDIMQYQCWIMDCFLIQYKISQLSRLMHILQIAGGMWISFAMSVSTHFDN